MCIRDRDKDDCVTANYARRRDGTGTFSVLLIDSENRSQAVLRVTVPLGMQLAPGTRLIIDQDMPAAAAYTSCHAGGCAAKYALSADVIGKLRGGDQLTVQAIQADGKPTSVVFALKDFGKAFDGPGNVLRISKPSKQPPPGGWQDDTLQRHLRPLPR